MATPKGSKEAIQVRRHKAYKLRVDDGLSFREIGEKLGVSHVQIVRDIYKAIQELQEPYIEDILKARTRENKKIDLIEKPLLEALEDLIIRKDDKEMVLEGLDLGVIDRLLKLQKRRSELNGYDAPVKIAPTTPDGQEPYQLIDSKLDELSTQDLIKLANKPITK